MDRRGGGQEGRVPHEEGAQGTLREEGGTLGWDVLTAPHAVVDLEVQGLVLLLDSAREKREKEGKVKGKELGGTGGTRGVGELLHHQIPRPHENSQSLPATKQRQFPLRNIPELFLLGTWVEKKKKSQLVQKLVSPSLGDLVTSPK